MSTIYLLKAECTLRKLGGRLVVEESGNKVMSLPVRQADSVVVGKAQLTTQAIQTLLLNKATVTYVDYSGQVLGVLAGDHMSSEKLLWQVERFTNGTVQNQLIRYVLAEKISQQSAMLRTYGKRRQDMTLKHLAAELGIYKKMLLQKGTADELRGVEGMASRCYFSGMPLMIDQEKWRWNGRNRRPARDPVNSLLGLGYAMLEKEVRIGIAGAGLDCRIGFFHSNNHRKDSLVFDLMELFRQNIIDKMTIKLLNQKIIQQDDFYYEKEACLLTDEARRKWHIKYEEFISQVVHGEHKQNYRELIKQEIEKFVSVVKEIA